MKKWDYQILNTGERDDWVKILEVIKNLGKVGWELVTVTKDLHAGDLERHLYIFKKPLEE